MTNVPTSRQTRPPGLAITSAQQAPGECLRVAGAGKELFSATFQTHPRRGDARSSSRAGCRDPATPRLRPEPPPRDRGHRGCPVPSCDFPAIFSPSEVPRRHPQSSGRPRDAHPRQGGPTAAVGFSRGEGEHRESDAFLAPQPRIFWLTSAPDRQPPGLSGFFQSFPYFQDFSCINITSNRSLFTAGINLHLLGETLSEFPPAFPHGGLGCPVIYAVSPRGSVLTFPVP